MEKGVRKKTTETQRTQRRFFEKRNKAKCTEKRRQ
jgi:hypothetical protein